MGIDPGIGSSPFDIVITEWVDDQIQIAYTDDFPRQDFNQMINITLSLVSKYGLTFENSCRTFVDEANPFFLRTYQLGEKADYEQEIDYYKKTFRGIYDLELLTSNMFAVPVHLAK